VSDKVDSVMIEGSRHNAKKGFKLHDQLDKQLISNLKSLELVVWNWAAGIDLEGAN
jgi:hypothetical protein